MFLFKGQKMTIQIEVRNLQNKRKLQTSVLQHKANTDVGCPIQENLQ